MPYTISIGRGPSNDIIVNQPAVSSSHAIITFAEDGSIIYTDNSTNGTTVNGKYVRGRSVYVHEGEIILLPGNILLNWNTINSRNPYSTMRPQREEPQPQPAPAPQPAFQAVESGVVTVDTPVAPRRNTCGLLSLIFSLVAIPLYFIPILNVIGLILGVVAFILGFIGVFRSPRGKAIAGMIISVLFPIIAWLVLMTALGMSIDGF